MNLIFIALRTTTYQIDTYNQHFSPELYNGVFEAIYSAISRTGFLDTKCKEEACVVISRIFYYYTDSLSNLSNFDANTLTIIFFYFISLNNTMEDRTPEYFEILLELKSNIETILTECDVSPDFIRCLSAYMGYYVDNEFSLLMPLLPKLQEAATYPNCHPGLANFLEEMAIEEIYGDDVTFTTSFITMMCDLAETQLTQTEVDIGDIELASYIFCQVFDSYGLPEVLAEYFPRTIELLPVLWQSPAEFFTILEFLSNSLITVFDEGIDCWGSIAGLLDKIIDFVDDEEIDNSELIKPDLVKSVRILCDIDDLEAPAADFYVHYFMSKLESPTSGIFFIAGSLVKEAIRNAVCPHYAALLSDLIKAETVPETAPFFIRECCDISAQYAEEFATCIFTTFRDEPTAENAHGIYVIAMKKASGFLGNCEQFVQPMLEWIPDAEALPAATLISVLAAVAPFVGINPSEYGPLYSELVSLAAAHAESLLDEPVQIAKFARSLTRTIAVSAGRAPHVLFYPMAEAVPKAAAEVVAQFCQAAFEQISGALGGLWEDGSPHIQAILCDVLCCFAVPQWIDRSVAIQWAEGALASAPSDTVLALIHKFTAPDEDLGEAVAAFLGTLGECEDPSLVRVALQMLIERAPKWEGYMAALAGIPVLQLVQSPDDSVALLAVQLVAATAQRPDAAEFCEAAIGAVIEAIAGRFTKELVRISAGVFEALAIHLGTVSTVQHIVQSIGGNQEAIVWAMEEKKQDRLGASLWEAIVEFRAAHAAQAQ